MKSCLLLLILGVTAKCLASPPLQLEDFRGFHSHKNYGKTISQDPPSNKDIQPYNILPQTVSPKKYTLYIRPILYTSGEDLEYTAPGRVTILTTCLNATNQIVLHKHPTLSINEASVTVTGPNNAAIPVTGTTFQEDLHFFTIQLSQTLVVGSDYEIFISFVAQISDTTDGLYRAQFTNAGKTSRMATTQFEPVSAREAFPCFDEPDLRATFEIFIAHHTDHTCLTNQGKLEDIQDETLPENWVWTHFRETKSMPTYLIAMVVAEDYGFVEATDKFTKPVGIYGPKHQIDAPRSGGDLALDAAAKIITYLEGKYEFPYEFDKIDSIAIPSGYFGAGAMENWGLNTYREEYLLYTEGESSEINRYRISSILTHELAHQWFGNLVTCKWWSELWLNEGFATYISFLGQQHYDPSFDALNEMLWDSVQYALAYDVDVNWSVRNSAISLSDLGGIFNTLTYDKGGALIRMMEGFLGEATLTKALVQYLQRFNYTGAEQDNLFEELQKQAVIDGVNLEGRTIKDIMDTWTLKPGFPLVKVSKVGSSRVYISQEKFTKVSSPNTNNINFNEFWEVPIAISTSTDPEFSTHAPKLWLSKSTISVSYPHNTDASNWIVVNPDGMGFYRVLYDNELTTLILNQLRTDPTQFSGLSRSQFIDDYFNLAKNGYIPISSPLEMTTYLATEDNRLVWYSLFSALTKSLSMFGNHGIQAYSGYFAPLIDAALERPPFADDLTTNGSPILLRAKLLDWACALESPKCISEAHEQFINLQAEPSKPIRLDYQIVTYCAIVAHGAEPAFEFFLERVNAAGTSDFDKARFLNALACTKSTTLLQHLLESTLMDDGTPIGSSTVGTLQRVAGNTNGRDAVFAFVRDNFEALRIKTGGVNFFASVVNTLSSVRTREAEKADLVSFIEANQEALAPVMPSLQNSLNNIDANIAWIEEFYHPMNTWLSDHV